MLPETRNRRTLLKRETRGPRVFVASIGSRAGVITLIQDCEPLVNQSEEPWSTVIRNK